MRKTACCVALLAGLLLPQRAFGLFPLRDGWTKLYVNSGLTPAIEQIVTDGGGLILYDYGPRTLVYLPEAQQSTVIARLLQINVNVMLPTGDGRISLAGATIDPRVGVPPNIDPSQKTFSYPPGQQGLYVVQMIGNAAGQWFDEISALGVLVEVSIGSDAFLVAATPEDARHLVDLPFLQFVDFLQPFEKANLSKFETSVRYDLNIAAIETKTASNDAAVAEIAEAVILRNGSSQISYLAVVRGEDVARLAKLPLVYSLGQQGVSLPHVWAAMPRRAAPGSTIIISGEGFGEPFRDGTSVTFAGVPSPQVEVLGDDRLRVRVPAGTPTGPIDLLVTAGKQHQFLSGASASGFHIDSPSRASFQTGDLITANVLFAPFFEGIIGGEIQWLDPRDVSLFVRRVTTFPNTLFVDPAGHVIFVSGDSATQYDLMSENSVAGPSFAAGATVVLFDRSGEAIVLRGNAVERRAANGSLKGSGSVPGSSVNQSIRIVSADLAADQCTLVYAMGEMVGAYDVCTFQPLPPIFHSTSNPAAVRVLPDGTLMVGDFNNVHIISRSGRVLATVDGGGGTALALSPDGSIAWIAGSGGIRSYDLRSGVTSARVFLSPGNTSVTTLAVYGGWSAARSPAITASPIPMISPLLLLLLSAALAVAGARQSLAGS